MSAMERITGEPAKDETSRFAAGAGNWQAFRAIGYDLDRVKVAAKGWARALSGVERPWLCWKVDDDWCAVQQRLVLSAGWTPVIGFDPRSGPPRKVMDGAIVVDFNAGLDFPVMYPHFPMEFVFWFCDRLAFWHSDLLLEKAVMKELAGQFAAIADGHTIATKPRTARRYFFSTRHKRYWELVGCTTKGASLRQFETGCGWWQTFFAHPNCPNEKERERRKRFHADHGGGIYYWHKYCGGAVTPLTDRRIFEGHFTKIGNPRYKGQFPRNTNDVMRLMSRELVDNFDLRQACAKMGLSDLL